MRRVLIASALVLFGFAASALAAVPPRTVTFLDASGEDAEAPDIRSVVVSTSVSGSITFRIGIPNRPMLTDDMRVSMWIDADRSVRTGLGTGTPFPGADYYVNWDSKLRSTASLLRCRPSHCTTVHASTFQFSYASGATVRLHVADLGEPRRLRFSVRAYSGIQGGRETGLDFSAMRVDVAPGEGRAWIYRLPRS
jgi:hypothetical protein